MLIQKIESTKFDYNNPEHNLTTKKNNQTGLYNFVCSIKTQQVI